MRGSWTVRKAVGACRVVIGRKKEKESMDEWMNKVKATQRSSLPSSPFPALPLSLPPQLTQHNACHTLPPRVEEADRVVESDERNEGDEAGRGNAKEEVGEGCGLPQGMRREGEKSEVEVRIKSLFPKFLTETKSLAFTFFLPSFLPPSLLSTSLPL